ncbi:MAG: GSU2403 family nucleotidyltransferase fold protein [Thermoleophilia bacterium]|nr:GSU2403 family nucleotidyltransferase fold protein [Thermoleophilia bacterium]
MPGERRAEVQARAALLDALTALGVHRDAVVLVGAQAIYLHTGEAPVALAPFTKDADLAIDRRRLGDHPPIEQAMRAAGFVPDPTARQPGTWLSPEGVPVDLMVPEAQSDPGGRRGARIPPHARDATRRAAGMEAAVVDNEVRTLTALDPADARKDAHDVYRLLVACRTDALARDLRRLTRDDLAGPVTRHALDLLAGLFASPEALGATMAGRAETAVGSPETVAASVALLAADLLSALAQ